MYPSLGLGLSLQKLSQFEKPGLHFRPGSCRFANPPKSAARRQRGVTRNRFHSRGRRSWTTTSRSSLHHIVIAGFIVFGEFAAMVRQLRTEN